MKKSKTKIIIIISFIAFVLALIPVVFAAFIFSKVVSGDATTGDIYSLNTSILNYSNYANYYGKTEREMEEEQLIPLPTLKGTTNTEVLAFLDNLKKRRPTPIEVSGGTIECYASERTGDDVENNDYDLPYLNQIGFKFDITTTIDLYVRIHFQDVWISKKVINKQGTISEQIITKDQVNGVYEEVQSVDESNYLAYYTIAETQATVYSNSSKYYIKDETGGLVKYNYVILNSDSFNEDNHPTYYTLSVHKQTEKVQFKSGTKYFKFSADSPFKITKKDEDTNEELWYCTYDYGSSNNDGYAYYKKKIDVNENNNEAESINEVFDIKSDYFYKEQTGAYYECVKIQLAYSVEVVQANRVEAIWHFNPENLF